VGCRLQCVCVSVLSHANRPKYIRRVCLMHLTRIRQPKPLLHCPPSLPLPLPIHTRPRANPELQGGVEPLRIRDKVSLRQR
jgi:hypothetical protein